MKSRFATKKRRDVHAYAADRMRWYFKQPRTLTTSVAAVTANIDAREMRLF